jgi:acetolactate synthase-1/3 small subunit
MSVSIPTLHTFIASLEDKPGALNRVASLFRRRAYNIVSLNVGRTHQPGISRLTVVVEGDDRVAKQLEAQLAKLINVFAVKNVSGPSVVVRDMALIKVRADVNRRTEVLQIAEVFRARVVDVGHESLTLEITGTQDKIDGLASVVAPFGIIELAQCGAVAMTRGVGASQRQARAA